MVWAFGKRGCEQGLEPSCCCIWKGPHSVVLQSLEKMSLEVLKNLFHDVRYLLEIGRGVMSGQLNWSSLGLQQKLAFAQKWGGPIHNLGSCDSTWVPRHLALHWGGWSTSSSTCTCPLSYPSGPRTALWRDPSTSFKWWCSRRETLCRRRRWWCARPWV